MKAIVTKYHGPSNVRRSRIIASDEDGNRVTVSYDDALNSEENHDAAMSALCYKMNWQGSLVRGSLKNGYVYVWHVNSAEVVPHYTR